MAQIPRQEVLDVLRKAGLTEQAEQLAGQLPDVVDLERARTLLAQQGLTREYLTERMGGSP